VAAGYSYLREAFVHHAIDLDTVRPMPQLNTTVIPHGPFVLPDAKKSRSDVRSTLGIAETAPVLLSFGHIRDGKNLDLVLDAMRQLPGVHLIVAGSKSQPGHKPVEHYQQLAESLGVADRCRWIIRYIPDDELGDLFRASDLVLLTYSARFKSASGVLNVAVHYRCPCLASDGGGNLCSVVRKYGLGIDIEPESVAALIDGVRRWQQQPPTPEWETYERENSWRRNAQLVIGRLIAGAQPTLAPVA
jgi:glycosyltransferase involved in cell wall biosynthesis